MKGKPSRKKLLMVIVVGTVGLMSTIAPSCPRYPELDGGTPATQLRPLAPFFAPNDIEYSVSQSPVLQPLDEYSGQPTRSELNESLATLPMSFERNDGQTEPQVKFFSRGRGYSLFLTPTESVFSFYRHNDSENKKHDSVLRMRLEGANPESKVIGMGKLPGFPQCVQDHPGLAEAELGPVVPGRLCLY